MGFFSWRTADTDEEIWNEYTTKPTKVTVVWPNGEKWIDATNDGYGRFFGKDIYAEIAIRNGWKDRDECIEKLFALDPSGKLEKLANAGSVVPKFFKNKDLNYDDITGHSKNAKYQGYFGTPGVDE